MKIYTTLFLAIVFLSCNGNIKQKIQTKPIEENWQIQREVSQKHTYNKSGLLDTTFRVEKHYVDGQVGVIWNFLVIRKYDTKNNLIVENTFALTDDEIKLSNVKTFKYDAKNNLTLQTNESFGETTETIRRRYNDKNQKIEEITITLMPEIRPESWTLDSAIAHRNDKKNPDYDTLSMAFEYDKKGNLVKEFYKNSNQEIVETVWTLYSDTVKINRFAIHSNGDTSSITNFKKQGNLIAEIRQSNKPIPYTDTTLYDGEKIVTHIYIDNSSFKIKETYKYDSKGNEIENISYK
jgi:hypothetical protein